MEKIRRYKLRAPTPKKSYRVRYEVQREIVIPGEEEERRPFYVAVTRARQELYLVYPSFAHDRAQFEILMEPSRFVRELPESLYEKWVIGE